MDITGWIILGVVVLVAFFAVGVYNGLIQLKNKVDEAWADIETQLKRRYDLIPNIVETVKGYAGHEKSTLENVQQVAAPSAANSPSRPAIVKRRWRPQAQPDW